MDVIVLAGGFGTRLRPWTSHMPKPLVPILDRAMIEHVVDVLPESVVTRVLIAAGYGIEKMRIHFEEMSLPYDVVIVEETEPLGTGGAIANCRPYLSGGTVCVINGDLLTSLQVEKMLVQHREDGNRKASQYLRPAKRGYQDGASATDWSAYFRPRAQDRDRFDASPKMEGNHRFLVQNTEEEN